METQVDSDGGYSLRVRFEPSQFLGGSVVFGGADRDVMSQSGGAELGLIRRVNFLAASTIPASDLRPTALDQLGLRSFRLDAPRKLLTLSRTPLLPPPARADALPLIDPREYGDGVEHVCCRVDMDEVVLDGVRRKSRRPILCVFDSGLTGCVLSQSLCEELGLRVTAGAARSGRRREVAGVKSLRVALRSERGARVVLGSSAAESPLFYVQPIELGWFVDYENGPHVVALGQCVLGRGALTVDGPQQRAVWEA